MSTTGKASVSVCWLHTHEGDSLEVIVRSRLAPTGFKGDDKNGDDLVAETDPAPAYPNDSVCCNTSLVSAACWSKLFASVLFEVTNPLAR